jgi:hypothetical protein
VLLSIDSYFLSFYFGKCARFPLHLALKPRQCQNRNRLGDGARANKILQPFEEVTCRKRQTSAKRDMSNPMAPERCNINRNEYALTPNVPLESGA